MKTFKRGNHLEPGEKKFAATNYPAVDSREHTNTKMWNESLAKTEPGRFDTKMEREVL